MISTTVSAEHPATDPPDYWELTRQPLPSLLFILPLLFLYEAGIALLSGDGGETLRNGADHWLRQGLTGLGLQISYVIPSLVVLALAAWHWLGHYPRRLSFEVQAGMAAESLLFGILLIVMGQTQDLLFQNFEALLLSVDAASLHFVNYLGAGIYEEVLFRLAALPTLYLAARLVRLPTPWATAVAVLGSSLLFSAAHYVGPGGDDYTHFSFLFRFLAGAYFAGLFLFRGLGIAVGAHAAYDLIVGLWLQA